jgi:hypothetical protein
MDQATMNKPSVFLVRARSADSNQNYYATQDQDDAPSFSPFSGDEGPLHQSRFRNLLRQFSSQDEADQFVKSQSEHSLKRFSAVAIEPAAPELLESFQTMDAERRASLQKLLPLVDQVLENFDFGRVQKAMAALDWIYAGDDATPSIDRLKETARGMLVSVAEDDNDLESHSGGFRAWRFRDKLFLAFTVETAYAEPGKASRL